MVCEWRTRSLGELTENYDSIRVPVKETDRRSGPYPYYGASGIVDYVDGYLFDGEYLLIAEDGENLRTRTTPIAFLARGKFWVNNHAHVVKGNGEADTRFLMYALAARDISGYLTGSTIPKLSQRALNQITLLTPPIDEQRAIAHILGTLDDKIELNRRMNATLEAIARAIFKSWFVDFDPVHAKARGEQPYGMDADTAALFPDAFEDSELGPIPAGWGIGALDTIAHFQNGLALQKYPPEDDEYLPVIKIRELRQGYSDNKSDKASPNIKEECILYDGDVVFSWSGSLLVDIWCGGKAALNQHLFKVTSETYPKWFYYYWTLHHLDEFQRIAADKATTMGHIKRGHLSAAKLPIPPRDLLERADEVIAPYLETQVINRLQARTLSELRDALLPKLISGEIRVSEAEALSGEVTP